MNAAYTPCSCDIAVWPDAEWCYRFELAEMNHRSDDYYFIYAGTPAYEAWLERSFDQEMGGLAH